MAEGNNNRSKGDKVRRMAENVIIICLAAIVALSGWKVYSILHNYNQQQSAYDNITKTAQKDEGFMGDIDFDALRKINPDIVGWIYYEDTLINYPIVKGEDNDKYLTTTFEGEYGNFGTLFADSVTEAPFKQFNTIVYGHHMRNGSMFGDLRKLKDQGFTRDHPRMELITPEGKYHLEIWAFLNQPSDSRIYSTNIADKEECAEYIQMIQDLAEYTTDVEVAPEDRIVELSTCAYEYQDARYVVACKMIPW